MILSFFPLISVLFKCHYCDVFITLDLQCNLKPGLVIPVRNIFKFLDFFLFKVFLFPYEFWNDFLCLCRTALELWKGFHWLCRLLFICGPFHTINTTNPLGVICLFCYLVQLFSFSVLMFLLCKYFITLHIF